MRHTMKLKEDPFERMKNGTKTIEFRLYDEKRRKIKVGDEIEFFKLPKLQERILVRVKNLYRGDSFKNLFKIIFPDKDNKEINNKTEEMLKKVTKRNAKSILAKDFLSFIGDILLSVVSGRRFPAAAYLES